MASETDVPSFSARWISLSMTAAIPLRRKFARSSWIFSFMAPR